MEVATTNVSFPLGISQNSFVREVVPSVAAEEVNIKITDSYNHYDKTIERFGRKYKGARQESLSDINWAVTILANTIKVVSAVLTIVTTDTNDRY